MPLTSSLHLLCGNKDFFIACQDVCSATVTKSIQRIRFFLSAPFLHVIVVLFLPVPSFISASPLPFPSVLSFFLLFYISPSFSCFSYFLRPSFNYSFSPSLQFLCTVVAILLHYFFMSTFAWMFVEGLHIYRMQTEQRNINYGAMRFYYAIGWGVPAIITGNTHMQTP